MSQQNKEHFTLYIWKLITTNSNPKLLMFRICDTILKPVIVYESET